MKQLLAHLARRQAVRIVRNGERVMSAGGDPVLVKVFELLGWSDPCPAVDAAPGEEAAVIDAPERAVLPRPTGRTS